MKNKSLITIICFAIAGLLILKFFNISLASIISSVLPFILLICGFVGLSNGKKVIGSILLVIGTVWCLSFIGKWLLLIISIGLVYVGITAYRSKRKYYY